MRWCWRFAAYGVLGAVLLVAAAVLGLRYWVLPKADDYRERIAASLTEAAGHRITIGRITADWEGLHPQFALTDVRIHDLAGKPAIVLQRIDSTLGWRSLLYREVRFHSLQVHEPALAVNRDRAGIITVAGLEMNRRSGEGGLADWLLRQRELLIVNAAIAWTDEQTGAPRLDLTRVSFQLVNEGARHRFGLCATAPAHLAGSLDIRGDVAGDSVRAIDGWRGQLFAQLDRADLGAWRQWIRYPVEIERGTGAVRVWAQFGGAALKQLIADVRLEGVRTRLADDLPMLDLTGMSGRFAWRETADGFEVTTTRLALASAGGLALPPANFLLKHARGAAGKPARGELRIDTMELEPLALLVEHLPLDAGLRDNLLAYAPQGNLGDLAVTWTGDVTAPVTYSVKGRFANLVSKSQGRIPGMSGITGTVQATEKGGELQLNSHAAEVDMPAVFPQPLAFDSLDVQGGWTHAKDHIEVRLRNVAFSNRDVAGSVSGSYRTASKGAGAIDLTGALTRADAKQVPAYLPFVIGDNTRNWLRTAVIAGQSNDVKFRLKGNLDDFPFADGRSGVFQVNIRLSGGVLAYAEGWPRLENIAADIVFRGKALDIAVREASMFDMRVQKARAGIADLVHANELLEMSAEAEGPTADFLRFIDESPVREMIDRFTEGMRAQGRGRLAIKVGLPLRNRRDTRVAGTFQLVDNSVNVDPDLPVLEQSNGRIEFTESAVRVPGINTLIAGGPATLTAGPGREGSTRVNVQGRANIENVRKVFDAPGFAQLRGTSDWRAVLTLRRRQADVVVESTLQGIAADLPAPLAKNAAEALPVRYERVLSGAQGDRIMLHVGDVLAVHVQRRREGAGMVVDRAAVRFAEAGSKPPADPSAAAVPSGGDEARERPAVPALPDRPGITIAGTLPSLSFDRWRAVGLPGDGPGPGPDLISVDVRVGRLEAFGRWFNEFALAAGRQGDTWTGRVASRELRGELTWRPQGRGRVVARLSQLTLPDIVAVAQAPGARPAAAVPTRATDLPAIDLVAEQFQYKERALGRLELVAIPDGPDWRIERLRVANPDATFVADGLYRASGGTARTQLTLRLEVIDAGKFLGRLGYPEGVRAGGAKIDGALSWDGPPQDIDYASLGGSLFLEAQKGRFVKLDPGIGKLLSILSLQALPRRITLDFKDVFSEGFEFDEIIGSLKINRGVATTDNFRILGSSARILMGGDVDLARETQKLRVTVTPMVGDSVATVTGLLGGPVVGIGIFLAQKLLNDPLGKLVSYDYGVTGTWSDPQVSKLAADAAPAAQGADRPR